MWLWPRAGMRMCSRPHGCETMPKLSFRGRIDLSKLTAEDRARIEQAIDILREMDAKGVMEMVVGHSRTWKTLRREQSFTITPQRQKILDLLHKREWATVRDISDATGMGDSSIGPNLTALLRAGMIEREVVEWPERKFGRKTQYRYRLMPSWISVPSPDGNR